MHEQTQPTFYNVTVFPSVPERFEITTRESVEELHVILLFSSEAVSNILQSFKN
jgi:hypothetical protein